MNGESKSDAPNYNEAFPTLGGGAPKPSTTTNKSPAIRPAFSSMKKQPAIQSRNMAGVTRNIVIPKNERRQSGMNEVRSEIAQIQTSTSSRIQFAVNANGSLNIIITAKNDQSLNSAINSLKSKLAEQGKEEIVIAKEFHRFILGRRGDNLRSLEEATGTKIRVPGPQTPDEKIIIAGPKDGIVRATQKIHEVARKQATRSVERLDIPFEFHAFIRGANDSKVELWHNQTKNMAKINIPPTSKKENVIIVTGDKDAVAQCVKNIKDVYDRKKDKMSEISVEIPCHQHRYIIGPKGSGIQEILSNHDVIVDVPMQESGSQTLTLRGEGQHLGPALNAVYVRANSITTVALQAPAWIRPKIIGQGGKAIDEFQKRFPGAQVDLNKKSPDKIEISGPIEIVDSAVLAMKILIKDILTNYAVREVIIKPEFFGQIIGQKGSNIRELKNQFQGLDIRIPKKDDNSDKIQIEGRPEDVKVVYEQLNTLAQKYANQVTETIQMDHKYHSFMMPIKNAIGKQHPDVTILFPQNQNNKQKSNDVVVRGPTKDVGVVSKELAKQYKDVIAKNYSVELPIMKTCHRVIIGRGGETIRQIRDEHEVQIEIPPGEGDSDLIKVTGRRQNVDQACKAIRLIESKQALIAEEHVTIDKSLHRQLIGVKGNQVKSLMKELGVFIQFPDASDSGAGDVLIRGEADKVKQAKVQLVEIAKQKLEESYQADVICPTEYIRFIIGKSGNNSKKIREDYDVKLIFPEFNKADNIIVMGKEANVKKAKAYLDQEIKNLKMTKEITVKVPKEYHSHFLQRGKSGALVHTLAEEYAGTVIKLPPRESDSDEVKISGPGDCVELVGKKIEDIIEDLKHRVTLDVELPCNSRQLRSVIGPQGSRIIPIESEFNVNIRFPRKDEQDDTAETVVVTISGHKDKLEDAKIKLIALVPMTEEYELPAEYHRLLLGNRGECIRKLTTDYEVTIKVPKRTAESQSTETNATEDKNSNNFSNTNVIKLTGTQPKIERVKEEIEKLKAGWDLEINDIYLRSYTLEIDIPVVFHSKIIGKGGEMVNKLRNDFEVNVQFPKREQTENTTIISITGLKDSTHAAADKIQEICNELENHVSKGVEIDATVHSRIIGQRGRGIKRLQRDHNVQIKFPQNATNEEEARVIMVQGASQSVDAAIDELMNLEEEFLQDKGEGDENVGEYQPKIAAQECFRDLATEKKGKNSRQQEQKYSAPSGAPWARGQDGDNANQFPSIGRSGPGGENIQKLGAWAGKM